LIYIVSLIKHYKILQIILYTQLLYKAISSWLFD